MIRIPLAARSIKHRPFVSSVLFTRTWEHESLTDLKARRSSPKALRIRQDSTRNASTAPQPTKEIALDFTNINIPDISQPDLEADIQIPFVPDFWESSQAKTVGPTESTLPKLLVVAGADTHHGGGPSHNLLDEHHSHNTDDSESSVKITPSGFWQDVVQDIGIPTNIYGKDTKLAVFDHVLDTFGSVTQHTRTLGKDETRGVWILLGLLVGSWVLGGVVNDRPATKKVTEHSEGKI